MSHFANKEDLLQTIQMYFEKIDAGKLNAEELEDLVLKTRDLHERAVILRYKAYEEKVLGVKEIPQQIEVNISDTWAQAVPFEQVEQVVLEEEKRHEDELKEEVNEEKIELTTEESPLLEFSVEDKIDSGFAFDLFDSNEPTNEILTEEKIETLNNQESFIEEENSIVDEKHEDNSTFELKDDYSSIHNSNVETETPSSIHMNDPFKGLYLSDQTDLPTFMKVKIYSLNGSFGLNEKMQFIQELFHGSSEEFNHFVHEIDQLEAFEGARLKLVQLSNAKNWDLESKVVSEFIQKIERRFL